jgi:hypothetical protein
MTRARATPVADHDRLVEILTANLRRASEAGLVARLQKQLDDLLASNKGREPSK